MSPFTFLLFLFALVCTVLAAPASLEKRITHTGRGTWFDVGLGACGKTNVNSDKIVAISSEIYGSGGNCEQYIQITNTKNGKVAYGKVRDECPGCGKYDLDMSPSLFKALGASLDVGVLSLSWHFENKAFKP
ncbi:RlpA-like double-psi beta-barrel-protein domain-containing protein-containing protein [Epithele typhae]|uniref:RlpA-like double-psi beta-barrel-protein domain-containing protein-containing protein n=1 Tax=Epithele typhae TaxID=378194 RepID=UPI002007593C|nr:RlpA-like double-psi beta-barrel-protein domain-containing protein-containing protein [Epithele typhae]KAH9933233.1 RlpA-like double-psi beta-barrel-protein domain-containing protein-containing protein [Epithele typhae]